MAKMGRPSKITPALTDELLARVSEGEPLAQVCRDPKMPALRTVYDWLAKDSELSARFARARTAGYDMIAADVLRIADTPLEATTISDNDKFGRTVKREDALGHRKLQVETRMKLLACWDPKRYGQRVDVEGTVNHTHAFPSAFAQLMAQETGASVGAPTAQTH
jgi:hypothetical protein